uniref:Uncharacterized protein n=1 Tax=Anguilla anguilla TaxID=7936 RepID=A0A0E9U5R3_ANGAN
MHQPASRLAWPEFLCAQLFDTGRAHFNQVTVNWLKRTPRDTQLCPCSITTKTEKEAESTTTCK